VTLESKRVLLDCRWLGLGGAGRATELLLRGLTELRPPGRWILWGPADVAAFAWDGAMHVPSNGPPKALGGQRALRAVPRNDLAIYLHQIRPLRPGSSVTVIHDTIPLRHGGSAANRLAKRLFYRAAAARSTRIVTVSEHSRRSIERDLGVPPDRISVVTYPVDEELSRRVLALRATLAPQQTALYVGSFARHKNLERLLLAFAETSFRRHGGMLVLTGGEAQRVGELRSFARAHGVGCVRIEGPSPQTRLEELYATSRLLVQPSLEEGFGLPVWEAMCCGVAVCASDAGSLPEITRGLARTFSPTSVPELTRAIDEVAGDSGADIQGQLTADAPSVEEFAQRFVDVAEAAVR
jgi:glycosyltransferase involved in cell wall biosynthesis